MPHYQQKTHCKVWCARKHLDHTKRDPAYAHIKKEHASGLTNWEKTKPALLERHWNEIR